MFAITPFTITLFEVFFAIVQKWQLALTFLVEPFGQIFRTFCESFDSRSPKVRSPGQVKGPILKQNLAIVSRPQCSGTETDLKHLGIGIPPSMKV